MPDDPTIEITESDPVDPTPEPKPAPKAAPKPAATLPDTPPEKKGGKAAADEDEDGERITLTSKALKSRMDRVADKTTADLLKQHGLASWEDIAVMRKAADDLKALTMSEKERVQAEHEALTTQVKTAEGKASTAEQQLTQAQAEVETAKRKGVEDRIAYQIGLAAAKEHADEPQDVIDFLYRDFRTEYDAVADAEGAIDKEKVKALIEKAKQSRPKWFSPPRSGVGSPSNALGRPIDPTNGADIRKRALRTNQKILRG